MNNIKRFYIEKCIYTAATVMFATFSASCIITGFDSVNEYKNAINYAIQYFGMSFQLLSIVFMTWIFERQEKQLYSTALIATIKENAIKEAEEYNKEEQERIKCSLTR